MTLIKKHKKIWIAALFLFAIAGIGTFDIWHANLHPFLDTNGFCFICESAPVSTPSTESHYALKQIPVSGQVVAESYENNYAEPALNLIKSRSPPFSVSNAFNNFNNNCPFETHKRRNVLCLNLFVSYINWSA